MNKIKLASLVLVAGLIAAVACVPMKAEAQVATGLESVKKGLDYAGKINDVAGKVIPAISKYTGPVGWAITGVETGVEGFDRWRSTGDPTATANAIGESLTQTLFHASYGDVMRAMGIYNWDSMVPSWAQ